MPEAGLQVVERIIANTINETARGDPDALAAQIVTALGEAGYRILPANGMEDISPGDQSFDELKQLYRSSNGDTWFLARDPATGSAIVRHQANAPSGGQVTDIELSTFLRDPRNPEHEALLRLIGNSILDPQSADKEEVSFAIVRAALFS